MSQHDFTIDNQGFPAFRSDLNSALQSLASLNGGATEPSTSFAYQPWYDTTNNVLKIRNADNDAWISLISFDQTLDTATINSDVLPEATTSQAGALETATDTEAKGVSATDKIVTPGNLSAVFAEPPTLGGATRAPVNCTTLDANSTLTLSAATRRISMNGNIYSYDQSVTNNTWYTVTGMADRGAFILIACLTSNDGPAAVFYGADDSNYYGGSITRALSHGGSAGIYSGTELEMDWPGSSTPRIRWNGTGASPAIRIWHAKV